LEPPRPSLVSPIRSRAVTGRRGIYSPNPAAAGGEFRQHRPEICPGPARSRNALAGSRGTPVAGMRHGAVCEPLGQKIKKDNAAWASGAVRPDKVRTAAATRRDARRSATGRAASADRVCHDDVAKPHTPAPLSASRSAVSLLSVVTRGAISTLLTPSRAPERPTGRVPGRHDDAKHGSRDPPARAACLAAQDRTAAAQMVRSNSADLARRQRQCRPRGWRGWSHRHAPRPVHDPVGDR
jgi:hypothetical protein